MSKTRPLARMAAGAAGLACVGAMLAAPAGAAVPAYASGHNAATALSGSGPIAVPTISAVTFAGKTADHSLLELPANDLVSAKVLHSTAKADSARAAVADVLIKKLDLSAHAIVAKCSHGMGKVDLVSAEAHGQKLAVSPSKNSSIKVGLGTLGTAVVTLNKQTHAADGSLTVTAIEAQVPLGGKTETIDISTATCAPHHGKAPGGPGKPQPSQPPSAQPSQPPSNNGQAPAPTPVHHDLPVTG